MNRIKTSRIYNPNHINGNFKRIEEWIKKNEFSNVDLMAMVCAKFSQMPQVRSGEYKLHNVEIIVNDTKFKITIEVEN